MRFISMCSYVQYVIAPIFELPLLIYFTFIVVLQTSMTNIVDISFNALCIRWFPNQVFDFCLILKQFWVYICIPIIAVNWLHVKLWST